MAYSAGVSFSFGWVLCTSGWANARATFILYTVVPRVFAISAWLIFLPPICFAPHLTTRPIINWATILAQGSLLYFYGSFITVVATPKKTRPLKIIIIELK
jgi:drug/metabolite transporter (DMT)-like permease